MTKFKNVDKDGPQVARLSTQATEQIEALMKEGKSLEEAKEKVEQSLVDKNIPYHLIEVILREVDAMI